MRVYLSLSTQMKGFFKMPGAGCLWLLCSSYYFWTGVARTVEQHQEDSTDCKTTSGTLAGKRGYLYTQKDC